VTCTAARFVAATRPWDLAKEEQQGDRNAAAHLDVVLTALLLACRTLAREVQPFLPAAAGRIERALAERGPDLGRRLFAKVDPPEPYPGSLSSDRQR